MRVFLRWHKEIDFGNIKAKDYKEAIEIAKQQLMAGERNLPEEETYTKMEIENEQEEIIYKENF